MAIEAILKINVRAPSPGTLIGKNPITVSGTVHAIGEDGQFYDEITLVKVEQINVTFGAGGPSVPATMTGFQTWTCQGSVAANVPDGQSVDITVEALAAVLNETFQPGEQNVAASGTGSVSVVMEAKKPELTVNFASPVETPTFPHAFRFFGTARHQASGIASVRYKINDGVFADVDNPKGDWSEWSKTISVAEPGTFTLTVEASGKPPFHLTNTSNPYTVIIKRPFEPTDVEQVFAATTYLRELMEFSQRQIKIGGGNGPNPQVLTNRFYQPYDWLTATQHFAAATRPVSQIRVAIESLRADLQRKTIAVPAQLEQDFRFAAYQALLSQLGVSYEELRLARLAGQPEREALAARLGIELAASRPDYLDRLTLSPATASDADLQTIFGYIHPGSLDPLAPATEAELTMQRRGQLRSFWKAEDSRLRDAAALPIVDPDLISADHIGNHVNNSAYALWNARRTWIAETLAAIESEGANLATPLARFDQIINRFVGNIDIAALAARDALGENLSLDLTAFHLDGPGFRFLARCRALLATGSLLESEWEDVFAIVLQAQKKAQFSNWRTQERNADLVLEPDRFLADADTAKIADWRGAARDFTQWRRTLQARTKQRQALEDGYAKSLETVEAQTLPALRDALLDLAGQAQTPAEAREATAERLSRELAIDLRRHGEALTTRVDQALETLQQVLFAVRSGRAGGDWSLTEPDFDPEWQWMSSYQTWLAAIRLFAYPENQLFPNLYRADVQQTLMPSNAFIGPNGLIAQLRKIAKLTPDSARKLAADYIAALRIETPVPPGNPATSLPADFVLTDKQMTAAELQNRLNLIANLFQDRSDPQRPRPITDPNAIPQYLREVFWLVPMTLALRLQQERDFLTALDWYQTVYAFDLPPAQRKRYPGLAMEENVKSSYSRTPEWLVEELNPHVIARTATTQQNELVGRKNVYTRFTVMAIVRCFLEYADQEFSRNVAESVAKARTLYQTAVDLLLTNPQLPEPGVSAVFPPNPVWASLLLRANANLAKIHNGMNIAGVRAALPGATQTPLAFLPSHYRYGYLVERAKNLVGIAQQVETAFLSAMQQRDEEEYRRNQAEHDIKVAGASINLANLKLADADIIQSEAELQKSRAEVQRDHFSDLLREGLNVWETSAMAGMALATALYDAQAWMLWTNNSAQTASSAAQLAQTIASFERRKQEWQLQNNLAKMDVAIGFQQVAHAQNQKKVAEQEKNLAVLQLEHAESVMSYLANKFTNTELYEWMSGILGGVYAYFLQQTTALAQLAEMQLAFERQEPPQGFIRGDYWVDTSTDAASNADQPDRRGLTGSARLLQDIYRLDQYAFDTDKRKLHLTQTLSLAQLGPLELQQFRNSGVLTFATPEALFDREFPGHYLRLVKRVKVSLIALVPPVRGIRASFSASGLSRTVVAGDSFAPVLLSRSPESIAFTSPLNASGLFELEADNGMLLPFEGMGVDAVWRLELPKPANPFDYRSIADVLLTLEYTALQSYDYRQKVVRQLDRSFTGDRAFSVREQFADAWYELNNPEQIAPERQMRIELPIRREDFPPHLQSLSLEQLTLFCVRNDGYVAELKILSLTHAIPGLNSVTAGEAQTRGGIVGTRRPNGAPWQALVGRHPAGDWTLQLENTPLIRAAIKDESISDLVLVMTVNGTTPEWPQ